MATPLVVMTDSVFQSLDSVHEVLSQIGAEVRLLDKATPEAISEAARSADGMIVCYAKVPGDVIRNGY